MIFDRTGRSIVGPDGRLRAFTAERQVVVTTYMHAHLRDIDARRGLVIELGEEATAALVVSEREIARVRRGRRPADTGQMTLEVR